MTTLGFEAKADQPGEWLSELWGWERGDAEYGKGRIWGKDRIGKELLLTRNDDLRPTLPGLKLGGGFTKAMNDKMSSGLTTAEKSQRFRRRPDKTQTKMLER